MVHLSIIPESSLADVPVWICVSDLVPSQIVTLHASLTDEKGVRFEARAFYRANNAGEVDLKQAPALGGDYVGVWPMGLFSSLKPNKMHHRLMKRDVMGSPFHIQISLYDAYKVMPSSMDVPLKRCTVERWYVAPGVERFQIKTGRVRGALFVPPGPGPFPGVIDLFGGSGGLFEFRASLLASKGFVVLALAYFAYDDLPQTLTEVNLEYFEEASILLLKHPKAASRAYCKDLATKLAARVHPGSISAPRASLAAIFSSWKTPGLEESHTEWPWEQGWTRDGPWQRFQWLNPFSKLRMQPNLKFKPDQVKGPGLGVIGLSKGAEIALAMATFLPQILATVCINGATSIINTSLHFRNVHIPAVPHAQEKILITETGLFASLHVMGDPQNERYQASAIPVEKAQGPVLFIVGEADEALKSMLYAEAAIARAKKYGKNNCTLLSYPGAGHLIEPPGSPLCYVSRMQQSSLPIQWGGKIEPHVKAQEHSWKEILKFLECNLGPLQNSNL